MAAGGLSVNDSLAAPQSHSPARPNPATESVAVEAAGEQHALQDFAAFQRQMRLEQPQRPALTPERVSKLEARGFESIEPPSCLHAQIEFTAAVNTALGHPEAASALFEQLREGTTQVSSPRDTMSTCQPCCFA